MVRYFLGAHKQTPTLAIKGDSGWLNMKYKHYLNMLKYYNHLLTMPNDQLTPIFIQICFTPHNNNNWCGNVEKILQILDKEDHLRNHETIEINKAHKALEYINNEEFQEKIFDKPKLRLYQIFKRNIETEKYLTANLSRYERSIIAQLRTGTLTLAIETGTFKKSHLKIDYVFYVIVI